MIMNLWFEYPFEILSMIIAEGLIDVILLCHYLVHKHQRQ